MAQNNRMNLTQFNANKCKPAFDAFLVRLSKNNIDIGLVSEPRHYNNKIPNPGGYDLLYDTSGSKVPRTAVIIKRGIKYIPLYQFVSPDLVAVEIKADFSGSYINVVIASGYHDVNTDSVPPLLKKLVDFCKAEDKQLLYECDANAHNEIWGSKKTRPRGREFLDFLVAEDLALANHGCTPTFHTIRQVGRQLQEFQDCIDLTFATPNLYQKIVNWKVSEDISLSDHRFIGFSVSMAVPEKVSYRNPRNTDWVKFNELLEVKMADIDLNIRNQHQLNSSVEKFNMILQICYYESCPEISLCNNKNSKWWNNNLTKMRQDLRK